MKVGKVGGWKKTPPGLTTPWFTAHQVDKNIGWIDSHCTDASLVSNGCIVRHVHIVQLKPSWSQMTKTGP